MPRLNQQDGTAERFQRAGKELVLAPDRAKGAPDQHYLMVGRLTTIVGVVLSIFTAYLAQSFNTINDFLQLVFSFVNAPLFATFLLGMFWKRASGDGAFFGLLGGTLAAAITHGCTVAEAKGVVDQLSGKTACPADWYNQARNVTVTVNGAEITVPRHLVVATRVNPNAANASTRRLQIRAWNRKEELSIEHRLPPEAAVDIASAHLFGMFRALRLRENALALALSVQLRAEIRRRQERGTLLTEEYRERAEPTIGRGACPRRSRAGANDSRGTRTGVGRESGGGSCGGRPCGVRALESLKECTAENAKNAEKRRDLASAVPALSAVWSLL